MQTQVANFIDYSLFSKDFQHLPLQPMLLINTINPYSYCIAHKDSSFKKSLLGSDVLLPDGIGIVIAMRFLTGQKIKKIAGDDLHHYMLDLLNKKAGSCFYLGSSDKTLQKIKYKLSVEFPNIRVATYSPPFKSKFSDEDNKRIINTVNSFQPEVLFIGMTAPKQEKWVHQHKSELNAKIIGTIGAAFDFYAGTVKRPHKIWRSLYLEWFIRMVKEPKRLWKRYLYFGPVFIGLILKEKGNRTLKFLIKDNRAVPTRDQTDKGVKLTHIDLLHKKDD